MQLVSCTLVHGDIITYRATMTRKPLKLIIGTLRREFGFLDFIGKRVFVWPGNEFWTGCDQQPSNESLVVRLQEYWM
jgi:hypothetical protein